MARSNRRRWGLRALLGAALAILTALTGCAAGTADTSAQTPTATRTASSPVVLRIGVGSYTTTGARTTLRGSATRGAKVKVDGHGATMRAGRWRSTLALHLGANHVLVAATMPGRRSAVRSITITRRHTQVEIEAQVTQRREAETRALAAHEAEAQARAKREGEARQSEQAAGEAKSREAETTACTNGTYVNAAGNNVCKPEHSPTVPVGATARCVDGTYSFSESRSGTCSHHGGVAEWLSG